VKAAVIMSAGLLALSGCASQMVSIRSVPDQTPAADNAAAMASAAAFAEAVSTESGAEKPGTDKPGTDKPGAAEPGSTEPGSAEAANGPPPEARGTAGSAAIDAGGRAADVHL
jgi:hypothetical protein